jgi:sec-independent protein translocase protein TatC
MSREKELSLSGHLRELRGRLLKSVIAVAVGIAVSFPFTPYVFNILKSRAQNIELIYTHVAEYLGTYMKLSLYCGIALALPFLVYQLVMFVSPALRAKEKRYLYFLMPGVALFFAAGVAFCYFILLPPALKFLLTFGSDVARPLITIQNYVSVVIRLLFSLGVVFEIPLLMFFLSKIGVVTPQWIAKNRKYAMVAAFVLGAIITPTMDPINQTLVAAPIIVLWEISIWLAKLARPAKKLAPSTSEVLD